MASNRSSSNGPDLMDVEAAWEGLSTMDKVTIKINLRWETLPSYDGLVLIAEAWGSENVGMEAKCLVSARLRCSTTEHKNLDTACIRLLYLLDGAIAKAEMNGTISRR